MPAKKIVIISVVSALVILGVGFMVTQVNGGSYIPQGFFEERIAGAGAAKNVARLVSDSLANLAKIEALDREGNTTKALELTAYEHSNVREKQDAAVLLASHLEKMAKATENIKPADARQLSVEAVSTGVAMVSKLISYNSYLENLFVALNAKFSRQPYSGPNVAQLAASINAEAQAINQLNQKFNGLLEEFDRRFVN